MLILPSKTIISFMEPREKRIFLLLRPISFPGGSDGKESACNAGDMGLIPGSGRSPGEGNDNPLVFLPGKFHGQRSLAGYSLWGHKESDTIEQLTLHFQTESKK